MTTVVAGVAILSFLLALTMWLARLLPSPKPHEGPVLFAAFGACCLLAALIMWWLT